MLESRYEHCAIALNDSIFAFGGYNGTYLSSMERYEIARDEWLPSSAMREKRLNFFRVSNGLHKLTYSELVQLASFSTISFMVLFFFRFIVL